MTSNIFTFGTLVDDEVIASLLGVVPRNFYATLDGQAVYRGTFEQLPTLVRQRLTHVDPNTFKFLFVKPKAASSQVAGRLYQVTPAQEKILDQWELFPDWYRKRTVTVTTADGASHEAFLYTLDCDGEELTDFTRVPNDREFTLDRARRTRARVLRKLPNT